MDIEGISRKLYELRVTRRISQSEVCNAVGISQAALSAYENGERIPRDEVKIELAKFYGVGVADIFFASNVTKSDM